MEAAPPGHRNCALDREARELVPEGDAVLVLAKHPGREAGIEVRGLAGRHGFEQPELGPPGDERDDVEQQTRGRVERRDAREHRVAHRLGERPCAAREHFGHVEGISGGEPVERVAVGPVRHRKGADRVEREPRHAQS